MDQIENQISETVEAIDGEILPPEPKRKRPPRSSSKRTAQRAGGGGQRIRSIRGYRLRAQAIMIKAERGEISTKDAQRLCNIIKAQVEMLMAENIMAANGGDVEAEDHPLGPDGGASEVPLEMAPHRTKKITRETGTGRWGEEIDKRKTTVESSGPDEGLERELDKEDEIQALL